METVLLLLLIVEQLKYKRHEVPLHVPSSPWTLLACSMPQA